MSNNHLDPNPPKFKANDGNPKLFSMNQSRGLLDSKRINGHPEQPSNTAFYDSNKTPRISLTSLLANSHRNLTPMNPQRGEEEKTNGAVCMLDRIVQI